MFDDPKKELERLQKELLAAREEPEDEDIDADQALEDVRRMLAREDWEEEAPPRRTAIYDYEEDEDPEPPRPRRRSRYGFLLAVLVLETVALAVMALWWFLWLM